MSETLPVEDFLALVIAHFDGRVEIPFEEVKPERIAGKVIAIDGNEKANTLVITLVDADEVDYEETDETE